VPLKLADFILKDLVYKQQPDESYVFDSNGGFEKVDRNQVVDSISDLLKTIYAGIIKRNRANPGEIHCNFYLLDKALTRYSRDIFGELRLDAKIKNLKRLGRITEKQEEQLTVYSDYGLKTDSRSPYLHRRLANLFYWLSVLKPFSIYTDGKSGAEVSLGVAFEFHNEYISYLFMLAVLKLLNCTLTLHKTKDLFYDFLYDLHFRSLSRSSMELFLDLYITEIE
jgi:hypothetical protein